MRLNDNFIMREIGGEYIVVPTGETARKYNGLISVNETGAFLWEELQEEVTIEQLVHKVVQKYEVDEETARKDIEVYIEKFQSRGLLNI